MPFEPGGYSDKLGNRFEGRWVVRQLLLLLHERIRSVTIEAVGDDEQGVDLWVGRLDGAREGQQCKARNGAKSDWTFADLARRGVLDYARAQLARDPDHEFAFVSAVPATWLRDLSESARNSTGDPEAFFAHQITAVGEDRVRQFKDLCTRLEVNPDTPVGRSTAYDFLRRVHFHNYSDDRHTRDDLRCMAQVSVVADPDLVIAALADFAEQSLRRTLIASDLHRHLATLGLSVRCLVEDDRIAPRIEDLREEFRESIRPRLAAGQLIPRPEADGILAYLTAEKPPEVVILHGRAGFGKSGILYQVTEALESTGIPFIALRLDRRSLQGSPRRLGVDLGLRESPAICLAELAADRQSVLFLDQLDALRWTSAHAAEGIEVCKGLIREVRTQRLIGRNLTVVIACRTFDLEHDPQIREWLRSSKERGIEKVEVGELPQAVVREIVQSKGVNASRITARRFSLLASVQNLAMWVEIVDSGEPSPDFDSATQLMREFWKNRRRAVEAAGFSPSERDALIDTLVDYMERYSVLSAPARIIEGSAGLSHELQTLGIIQVTGRTVTFCHQSYLDFLIANRAASSIDEGSLSVRDWLGDRSRQSLFRREQLRQLLFLLADDSPAQLGATVCDILRDDEIRFHIKQLTLETLGQTTPTEGSNTLVATLLEDEQWREYVLQLVVRGQPAYISALGQRGTLQQWLSSGDEWLENRALWLLGSVSDRCGELVADLCEAHIRREGWADRIALAVLTSAPESEPEKLFEMRLACIQMGAAADYVPWKQVAAARPDRALRLLACHLARVPEADGRTFSRHSVLESPDHRRALLGAAARRPKLAWRLLAPEMLRLVAERRRQRRELRQAGVRIYSYSTDSLVRIPRVLIQTLRTAGRRLARGTPKWLLRFSRPLQRPRSQVVQRLLCDCFAVLPPRFADWSIEWLLRDIRNLRCGSGRQHAPWSPAARLIQSASPHCSDRLFVELERALLHYRDPEEYRLRGAWLADTREGIFRNRCGAAQHFLLPSLARSRRSLETISRIGVLARKFEGRDDEFFTGPRSIGGTVRSPLDREHIERISDSAWLRLIERSQTFKKETSWRRYGRGVVIESSIEMFSKDLRAAAHREPARFARLTLCVPVTAHPAFFTVLLDALAKKTPPSEVPEEHRSAWKPASPAQVEAVLEGVPFFEEYGFAQEYCSVLANRDDIELSQVILDRLLSLTTHSDPRSEDLHVHCDQKPSECGVDVLETNAINCVRGLAAYAIAMILFRSPELLSRLRPAIERLLDDPHPAVRVAATRTCLPIWNINRELAVEFLLPGAKSSEPCVTQHS